MNRTLQLDLADTRHKGAVAGQVVLGVAVAAGLPPLAASRQARAVRSVCDALPGGLRLSAREDPDGARSIAINAPGAGWGDLPPAAAEVLGASINGRDLVFVLRRPPLRSR